MEYTILLYRLLLLAFFGFLCYQLKQWLMLKLNLKHQEKVMQMRQKHEKDILEQRQKHEKELLEQRHKFEKELLEKKQSDKIIKSFAKNQNITGDIKNLKNILENYK